VEGKMDPESPGKFMENHGKSWKFMENHGIS
jgi:hypothetical protein